MDITPQDNTTQPISDDQELAKALAGVLPDEPIVAADTPAADTITVTTSAPVIAPIADAPITPAVPVFDTPSFSTPEPAVNLDSIKSQALTDLRPLIDRVELPPEERFDAYLMLLRSTDDSTLVAPAHAAAQGISDEKRKAEALLEVIKEIDYLSRKDA
jgi:hypothetical protein